MNKKPKALLIGEALSDKALNAEKFNVLWGLPIYSSDAISSVSYAGEEILLVLFPVLALGSYPYMIGSMLSIIALLSILVVSYRQTIDSYPQGGGAYVVSGENLGQTSGLVAAASLIIGYVLTVAVSACAGTAAIESAFPELESYRTPIALGIIILLTWGNLRGMRESSRLFGVPTYLFVLLLVVLILVGLARVFFFGYVPPVPDVGADGMQDLLGTASLFLVLRAFASGCTALTGVEAVSNGVPSFRDPAVRNAKKVLLLLAVIIAVIFLGVSVLTSMYSITPDASKTILAQLAAAVFGASPAGRAMFYAVQAATAVILALAANTSFAGMPVLLALIAKDGYMPRQLMTRGSRLSFSNGILLLAALACVLVVLFRADTHLLMPLYATGVFLSFTLSQAGMLVHWYKSHAPGWKVKALINGTGAFVTAVTTIVIASTKFVQGAWIVLICIPLMVVLMRRIKNHYDRVTADLVIEGQESKLLLREPPATHIIIPLESVNRSFIKALNYALSLEGTANIELYHVGSSEENFEKLRRTVDSLQVPVTLVVEVTDYRDMSDTLLRHIDLEQSKLGPHQMLTVVIPDLVMKRPWHNLLHNQTSLKLRSQLQKRRNVSVISIPYHI